MVSRRRFAQVYSSDDEEDFVAETRSQGQNSRRPDDGTPVKPDDAKPVGEPVKVTGRGERRRNHYGQFEYKEENSLIPYIAIIKVLVYVLLNFCIMLINGRMMILGQWFYRQEDAKKKDGGNWVVNDTRELFYSFHRNEVPVESVMHRCLVYFVPDHKQLRRGRGFIVRKVYDTVDKKLWKLTDKDYAVSQQREIDLFVHKSLSRLGDLPDL
uniref:BAH domain-containing protein n=1 Tax=Brassica oleracea TaxID=3712 RepID=A0A3P6D5M2_BRAOL|nr:unnamed protein product [Brassica oleracea]